MNIPLHGGRAGQQDPENCQRRGMTGLFFVMDGSSSHIPRKTEEGDGEADRKTRVAGRIDGGGHLPEQPAVAEAADPREPAKHHL